MAGFLDGLTVLDLSGVGPAARATGWLADYGATVVKVGPVPGRSGVRIEPPVHAYSGGRGTERLLLDLKAPAGREVFLRLAEHADVVVESFRPGVVARLGIGYDDVKSRNPRVVYCSTTGFGQTGPRAQWAGHDLDYLAVAGYLDSSERAEGGKPPLPGATVADSAGGGLHAVAAILAALVARERTGEGAYLDVAVADGVLALMALQVDEHLATGRVPEPGTAPLAGRYACYDTYAARDGRWLAVAAIERRFWANLCRALGCEHWIGHQYDDDVQPRIRADLTAAFAARTRDEWVRELAAADTCVAPVLSVAEVAADEHFGSRGVLARAVHSEHGEIPQLAPLLAGAVREPGYRLPDRRDSDASAVLGRCGFTAAEVAALAESGVLA